MSLVLSEEQQLLQHTTREFVAGRSSLRRIRELRDQAGDGFSRDLWREMAQLGWAGIVLPEQYGGAGLGYVDLMVVMEELGRGLLPEPMLSTVLLGAGTLLLGGSAEQRAAHLPEVAAADALLALAQQEARSRYDLAHVETRAERAGDGYRLTGEKIQVLDGAAADHLIVSARTSGGIRDASGVTLFLVQERDWDVEVCEQIDTDLTETRRVKVRTLPAIGSLACTIHHGPFVTIGEAYNALGQWITDNGYRITGPCREVYLEPSKNGSQTDTDTVTEIQFPVEKVAK